ncbi:MAG: hypothetical protein JHC94_05350 [Acidimicrobiia bacterium]|nr:hypothetical protein [Acidimicrobiia bacterium]
MQSRRRKRSAPIIIVAALLGAIAWSSAAGAGVTSNSRLNRSSLVSAGDVLTPGETSKSPSVPDSTNLIAFQWRGEASPVIAVEARSDSGTWKRVATVGEADGGPDTGSGDAVAASSKL